MSNNLCSTEGCTLRVRATGARLLGLLHNREQRILEAADRQISAMMRARRVMSRTLHAWDQRLAATPSGATGPPARLLEQLAGGPANHVPAPAHFGVAAERATS